MAGQCAALNSGILSTMAIRSPASQPNGLTTAYFPAAKKMDCTFFRISLQLTQIPGKLRHELQDHGQFNVGAHPGYLCRERGRKGRHRPRTQRESIQGRS